ncbi:hypothetical protein SLW73_13625 [Glutamicibacter protophormiae]|uniref:hypothetical protein n=1 Tax=Glutamicibacter protophormiae TaxID=37930 RepID=UPI002A82AC72|nr:hypothetical protein [Glutamicibacter protophormiae]WPR63913.1 hypothetical protein SLW72_13630 [Glutamicibacter protophormiae]WPR67408.1 hypothetical protein SLW73_13625 [Glutamicibacter protophormiae]
MKKPIDHEKLHKYLSEHHLGSAAGLEHFASAKRMWADTQHAAVFHSLWLQVKEDQQELERILKKLGREPHGLALLAEPWAKLLGKINLLNPLRQRRQTLAQTQLDVLTGLLNAKHSMWRTLLLMVGEEPTLDEALLSDLKLRAESQIRQLSEFSDSSWAERFR